MIILSFPIVNLQLLLNCRLEFDHSQFFLYDAIVQVIFSVSIWITFSFLIQNLDFCHWSIEVWTIFNLQLLLNSDWNLIKFQKYFINGCNYVSPILFSILIALWVSCMVFRKVSWAYYPFIIILVSKGTAHSRFLWWIERNWEQLMKSMPYSNFNCNFPLLRCLE